MSAVSARVGVSAPLCDKNLRKKHFKRRPHSVRRPASLRYTPLVQAAREFLLSQRTFGVTRTETQASTTHRSEVTQISVFFYLAGHVQRVSTQEQNMQTAQRQAVAGAQTGTRKQLRHQRLLTSNISTLVHQPLPLRLFALRRLPINNGYELVNDLMSDWRAGFAARVARNLIFALRRKCPAS